MNWLKFRENNSIEALGEKALANKLIDYCGGSRNLPIDVDRAATVLSIDVHKDSFTKSNWESSCRFNDKEAHLWINSDYEVTYQRFCLAHQLGHFLMHPQGEYRCKSSSRSSLETQANIFAANLLVPLWVLEPIALNKKYNVHDIQSMFQVSGHLLNMQLFALSGNSVQW